MSYLYGDSSPSELSSNFLEFLRDAIDFAVFLLDADDRIKKGKEQIRQRRQQMEVEQARLEKFVTHVSDAIASGEKGESDSPASSCAARLEASVVDAHRATIDEMRRSFAEYVARMEANEASLRSASRKALSAMLLPHDVHRATKVMKLVRGGEGRYASSVGFASTFGLGWAFELLVPEGNPWTGPVRLDRYVPQLEIRTPQLTGWFSKEVKVRPTRIDREIVTELIDDGKHLKLKLRTEPGIESGYDVAFDFEANTVKMSRVTTTETDASQGDFDVHPEDAAPLLALGQKIRASASELVRGQLLAAKFDDMDFEQAPEFTAFTNRLVAFMAPIVKEISDHSLQPTELVLRRSLGNDRREELFVAKATLREKYAGLAPELAAFFEPLALEVIPRSVPAPEPEHSPQTVRAEIARSVRPPPPPPSEADVEVTATESEEEIEATESDDDEAGGTNEETRQIDTSGISSDEMIEAAAPASVPTTAFGRGEGQQRNEELITSLKRIALLARQGQTSEAYREYGEMFASDAFASYRNEDQRQALKLMVMAKEPQRTGDVLEAFRKAITRIETLSDKTKEPADYEVLGMAHAFLAEAEKATEAFKKGLELERERNPQSELVGTLMRRLSAL